MKIYYPILTLDIMTLRNPYLRTFIQGITKVLPDTKISLGVDLFWQELSEEYDVIHIMWPEDLLLNNHSSVEVENRLKILKEKGVKIVTTCHNFHSHVPKSEDHNTVYDVVYSKSDVTIHLGKYSCDIFKERFPHIEQIIIPHHVYDTIYPQIYSKGESCKKLGLSSKKNYVLCMGAFRNDHEKKFACSIAKHLKNTNYYLLAPTYVERLERRYIHKYIMFLWFILKMRIKYPRLIIKGQPVSEGELPYYYGVSDISLIQRLDILNSGNLPLAYYMGKTVVGPNVGNVAVILNETGNFTFNSDLPDSVLGVLDYALSLDYQKIGECNRRLALNEWSTSNITQKVIKLYENILISKKK